MGYGVGSRIRRKAILGIQVMDVQEEKSRQRRGPNSPRQRETVQERSSTGITGRSRYPGGYPLFKRE